MQPKKRVCAVCGGAYTGTPHNHAPVGLPGAVVNMGPVSTPRPMVGTPPTKTKRR